MPLSVIDVERQVSAADQHAVVLSLCQKHLPHLAKILDESESISKAIVGSTAAGGFSLLIATNWRVIVLNDFPLSGFKTHLLPYDKITSIESHVGMFATEVTIHTSGISTRVDGMKKDYATEFIEYVESVRSAAPAGSAATDLTLRFERLSQLKASGHLTEEEFAASKRKLLEG